MKRAYLPQKNFRPDRAQRLQQVIAIVEEYQNAGYKMTLRQLYYQLVARDIIPNQKTEYAKLSDLLADARLMGLVDWEFIEDRIRVPKIHSEFDGISDIIEAAVSSYRLPRWNDQDEYVEVWVEKDALSGLLAPVCDDYHVRLLVNRGFSSWTAMHDASLRFKRAERSGKKVSLIYFGDHDPSGSNMVLDIGKRLNDIFGCEVNVEKVALTMEQIEEYNPPPNPAKTTDSRFEAYAAEHGDQSWELDALPPDVLTRILTEAIDRHIDIDKYDAVKEREEKHKDRLRQFGDDFEEEEQDAENEDTES